MSDAPVEAQETAPPPATSSSWIVEFLKSYWFRLGLVILAIALLINFAVSYSVIEFLGIMMWMPIGMIRGLTGYRHLISGKPMSLIVAEERYNRQTKQAYDRAVGNLNLGNAVGGDHMKAAGMWMLGRLVRLIIVAVLWPLIELFFQIRFLLPAFQDARKSAIVA